MPSSVSELTHAAGVTLGAGGAGRDSSRVLQPVATPTARISAGAARARSARGPVTGQAQVWGSIKNSGWPYSTGWLFSTRIRATRPAVFDSISFISFIASMMQST